MKVKRSHKNVKFKYVVRFRDIDRPIPIVGGYFEIHSLMPKYVTIKGIKFIFDPTSFGTPMYVSEDYLQSSRKKKVVPEAAGRIRI